MGKGRWNRRGQGATEYGLILVLVAIVSMAALSALSLNMQVALDRTQTEVKKADTPVLPPTP